MTQAILILAWIIVVVFLGAFLIANIVQILAVRKFRKQLLAQKAQAETQLKAVQEELKNEREKMRKELNDLRKNYTQIMRSRQSEQQTQENAAE